MMRRPSGGGVASVGALLGAIFTTVALMGLPGVGIGQPTTSHGASPSDVFMKTQPAPEACVEEINPDSVTAFPLEIDVAVSSHVFASFTFEWTGLDRGEVGGLNLVLDGTGGSEQYDFAKTRPRINPNGTVTWSFPNVAQGTHTVAVFAVVNRIGSGDPDLLAGLENCSLTVFVAPVAG
jgi:hypothetical protein